MNLPVSYDRPETPLIGVDRNHPPPIPQLNDSRVNHLLIDIVVRIVNQTVIMASKNPIRMFAFNLLSQQNWVNSYFNELFRLCVDHLLHSMMRSPSVSPDALFEFSVDEVLNMYSSNLAFDFPELQSVISPQQKEACAKNAGLLNHFKTEIKNMSYQGQPHYQHQHMHGGHQPHYPQQQPYGYPTGYGHQPSPGPGYGYAPPQQPNYGHQGYQHYTPQHSNVPPHMQRPIHAGFGNTSRMPEVRNHHEQHRDYGTEDEAPRLSNQASQRQPAPNFHSSGDWRDEPVSRDVPTGQGTQQKHWFDRATAPVEEQYEPGELLSRDSTYDVVSTANISTRGKEVNREQHETGARTSVPTIEEQQSIDQLKNQPEITVNTDAGLGMDLSLEIPIAQFRANTIRSQEKSIGRKYLYVPVPIISKTNVPSQLGKWLKGDSLTAMALHLQTVLNQLSLTEDSSSHLSLLRELDSKLADKVNAFLRDKLEVKFTIQSFIDDYPDLPRHVLINVGVDHSDALKVFDQGLVASFDSKVMHDCVQDADFVKLPKDVYIGYVPYTYSVTIIPLDRAALKLPLTDKKIILERLEDRLIYEACKDLFLDFDQDNPFGEIVIDQHILVTSDGVKYRMGRTIGKDDLYLKRI